MALLVLISGSIAVQNNLPVSISGLPSPLPLPLGSRRGGSDCHPEIDSGCIRVAALNDPQLLTRTQVERGINAILKKYDPNYEI
jgi:hypothetical protein